MTLPIKRLVLYIHVFFLHVHIKVLYILSAARQFYINSSDCYACKSASNHSVTSIFYFQFKIICNRSSKKTCVLTKQEMELIRQCKNAHSQKVRLLGYRICMITFLAHR